VQSSQDREGEDFATLVIRRDRYTIQFWDLLFDALMRPGLIEVLHISPKDTIQLLLLEDEKMIKAFSPHTPQKSFTDRIGSRSMIRRFEHLDAAGCGYTSETGSKFAITITNEIVRRLPIRGCLSQLLCSPGIGRRASDTHMDDSPRVHIDNEESKQRPKERSVTCKKSHAQMSLAWFCRKVAQFCPRCLGERACLMYF
jgi:hypothetical protein